MDEVGLDIKYKTQRKYMLLWSITYGIFMLLTVATCYGLSVESRDIICNTIDGIMNSKYNTLFTIMFCVIQLVLFIGSVRSMIKYLLLKCEKRKCNEK
jgi:hypothetical protein